MKTINELKKEIGNLKHEINIKKPSRFSEALEIIVMKKEVQFQTLKEVLKLIDTWGKADCIDGKEKCHECIADLKAEIEEE